VDLLLGVAMDLERDRLVELEKRAAIEGDEFLSADLELHGHDRARFPAVHLESLLPEAADLPDLGVLEDGCVELRRLLGLRIEPQAGLDRRCSDLHDLLLHVLAFRGRSHRRSLARMDYRTGAFF